MCAPCPQRSPPRLLTDAACGGLEPPPARRLRRARLHLWHDRLPLGSTFYINPPSAFVAHHRRSSARTISQGTASPSRRRTHSARRGWLTTARSRLLQCCKTPC